MTTKTKTPTESVRQVPPEGLPLGSWPNPPWTTEERLQRIEAMGQRIQGYIQFMAKVASMNGTSAEAKDRAVIAFYERLIILEKQLDRIQEELKLG